jgi:esterase/lipase superfamily enzyme
VRAINTAAAAQPAGQREAFVFVHGFNTNFAEGLYRHAQMRHDFNAPGISVHYAWPSAASGSAYATDRETTLQARDDLEQLIELLASSNVSRIIVAAHSMGAFLAMEALRQKAIRDRPGAFDKIRTVVLMAPDIDVGVFRRQASALAEQDVSIYVFTSARDRALRFSAALRGSGDRLGALADTSQLPGLPVTIIDLTDVAGNEDPLNHFKVATSPVMIALIGGMRANGTEVLSGELRNQGVLGTGIKVVQNTASVVLAPFGAP